MAIYNTGADSANTAVRAFLTKIGEFYLGRSFNTSSGAAREDWIRIQNESFDSKCAYCGEENSKFTIEHLIMFNKSHCGLHHPGNIVPCCSQCNKRGKDDDGNYLHWRDHLSEVASKNNLDIRELKKREKKILDHIDKEGYPKLTDDEINTLKTIAAHLYSSIKTELDKSLDLFKEIDSSLVNKRRD